MFRLQFWDGAFLFAIRTLQLSISAAILILHCGPQYFSMHGALAQCTLTKRWGFKFWGPGSTVFTIKLKAPHSTRFDSIVFLAGGRRTAELGWAALGSHLETNIWHRRGVCHLLNLFPFTMFKLSQGPVQFLGLFFGR